jgi:hypothetical protein
MRFYWSPAAVLAFLPFAAGPASAGEYCVSCDGPDAHYACTFDGAANDSSDASIKLLCITELAKSSKHASCTIDRVQPKPCAGPVKVIAMPDGYQPAPAAETKPPVEAAKPVSPPQAATQAPAKPGAESAAPMPDAPPKTVKEMVEKGAASAGQTLEKSGDTAVEAAKSTGGVIGKAGKAVGDAAKKTWTCITSLFGDC